MLDLVKNKAFQLPFLLATMKVTYFGEAGQSKLGAYIPNICSLCIDITGFQLVVKFFPSVVSS